MNTEDKLVIYQAADGAIELPVDAKLETIWASQRQIAEVFCVNVRTVNEHLGNIFDTEELDRGSTVRKFRIVRIEGEREVEREIDHYNLDAIISVGYRVNSKNATAFRKWATKTLREDTGQVGSSEATDLALAFATTWLSLDAYDKSALPSSGTIKKAVDIGATDLEAELHKLRKTLIAKGEATDIFATERTKGGLHALFGNIFQSFAGEDVYPTVEEKAAHLLYFVVKNHVFVDGNKRSGAYAFVWFLQKTGLLNLHEISPQALTAITLLVAESKPEAKDKMIGLVLLMLKVDNGR